MRSLRNERLVKGITQEMLKEMTGIDQHQISVIERGKQKPNQSTRDRFETGGAASTLHPFFNSYLSLSILFARWPFTSGKILAYKAVMEISECREFLHELFNLKVAFYIVF